MADMPPGYAHTAKAFQFLPEDYMRLFNGEIEAISSMTTNDVMQHLGKLDMMLYELDKRRAELSARRKGTMKVLETREEELTLRTKEALRMSDETYKRDLALDTLSNPSKMAKVKQTVVKNLDSAIKNLIKAGFSEADARAYLERKASERNISGEDVRKASEKE